MMKIIDKDDAVIENFCSYVCSWCANGNDSCEPFGKCDWNDDFEEARGLMSELFYLEEDPDCLYGTSDDDYDFDAQYNAYHAVDERLHSLQNSLINDVQVDLIDYYQSFGYEM